MEIIRPIIDSSTQNTREFFRREFKTSTENNCAAGGVHFIYDLMMSQGDNFPQLFKNAFLIKAYTDIKTEERFQDDKRAIFDTGVVLQSENGFYSIFFGTHEGRLVHKSPDIKTLMEDFKWLRPGPWPDAQTVESLYEQVKFPTIKPFSNPYTRDKEDHQTDLSLDCLSLNAIVRRNGQTTVKQYAETFRQNQ